MAAAALLTKKQRLKRRTYQRKYFKNRYRTDPVFRENVKKKVLDWRAAHPVRAREISAGIQRRYRKKNPEKFLRLVCESGASAIVGQHEIDLANDTQRLTPDYIEALCLSLTRKPVKRTKNTPTPHKINIERGTERIL